jgi:ATP-dependent DNA ligase
VVRIHVPPRFDPLCNQVATELDLNDAILDGEVIAADKAGRPQLFNLPRRTLRPPFYLVFDILWLNGSDLRSLVLYDRRRLLERILPKGPRLSLRRSPLWAADESYSQSSVSTTSWAWWQSA